MGLDHSLEHVAECPGNCDHYCDDVPADEREPHLIMVETLISWRKENWLHDWFVQHVNNGETGFWRTEVSLEQLAGLAQTLARVDDEHNAELLPPSPGFFFGSTEVDEWYWQRIKQERVDIERVLDDERQRVQSGLPPRRFAYWCWW